MFSVRILAILVIAILIVAPQISAAAGSPSAGTVRNRSEARKNHAPSYGRAVAGRSPAPVTSYVLYPDPRPCQPIEAETMKAPLCDLPPEPLSATDECSMYGSDCTDEEACDFWSICTTDPQTSTPTAGVTAESPQMTS